MQSILVMAKFVGDRVICLQGGIRVGVTAVSNVVPFFDSFSWPVSSDEKIVIQATFYPNNKQRHFFHKSQSIP